VLSIFPIIEVDNPSAFAMKITVVLLGIEALGIALYVLGRRRKPGRP